MSLSMCEQVAERIALGEALGELSEHAGSCTSCQQLIAVSSRLGASRHAVDPGLGFTARMTVGAQHRLVARRRNRLAMGLAASVLAGGFGVFLVTRAPESAMLAADQPASERSETPSADDTAGNPGDDDDDKNTTPDPWEPAELAGDDDLAALVQLADVDQHLRESARWRDITAPLTPYRKLVNEQPEETP